MIDHKNLIPILIIAIPIGLLAIWIGMFVISKAQAYGWWKGMTKAIREEQEQNGNTRET